MRMCPICHKEYEGYPATSRVDGLPICPECGVDESLYAAGVPYDERERIKGLIRRAQAQHHV